MVGIFFEVNMIDITRWGRVYDPSNRIYKFLHFDISWDDSDRILDLAIKISRSSLDLTEIEHILLTFWLNMMDRKKKNDYSPNWWLFMKIGRKYHESITEVKSILNRIRAFKIINFVEATVKNEKISCLLTPERAYAVFALALIIWYFPNYLTKKEQKIYSNLSFEEMYNLVTGDNSLRGIIINDTDLYVENNE